MKKTLLCVLVCLMGCFFLSGCDFTKIPEPYGILEPSQALYEGLDQLKPQGPETKTASPSQERYSIVVDDGFGMKGFVAPFCMSYRAAISAVTSVSISAERACYRASDYARAMTEAVSSDESFFQSAVQEQFFQPKSNDIAKTIAAMAKSYREDPDQVMILISDLMIPTEDDCVTAAKALQEAVINPKHATMGIIGFLGEFRGSIENLPVSPITGQKRKLSDYMVLEREANGNFRHPLYMLFLGDDQAVLSAMQKALTALETSGLLDDKAKPHALYFSEYDIARRESDDIFSEFNLGCQQYNLANYSAQFLIRGVENENGEARYSSAAKIPQAYQQQLNAIPIVKLYDLERGNTAKNVKIRCTIPFTLLDSSQNGAEVLDRFNLLKPAKELTFALEDYTVSADIRVLNQGTSGTKQQATWVTPDARSIYCESAVIDENHRKIDVVLSVNTSLLVKDEPLICTVGVRVGISPQWAEIETLYDTEWIKQMTLNLKEFDKESIIVGKAESSARFTSATTEKTPFLSNLICAGIGEQQIVSVIKTLSEHTNACVQTTMFGMVVRDVPNRYLSNATWDEQEDFYGWAFSVKDALEIQSAID